jgi:hypothetical protein
MIYASLYPDKPLLCRSMVVFSATHLTVRREIVKFALVRYEAPRGGELPRG